MLVNLSLGDRHWPSWHLLPSLPVWCAVLFLSPWGAPAWFEFKSSFGIASSRSLLDFWPPSSVDCWGSQAGKMEGKMEDIEDDKGRKPNLSHLPKYHDHDGWLTVRGLCEEIRQDHDELQHCFNPKVQLKNRSTHGQMVKLPVLLSHQPRYIGFQYAEVCVGAFPPDSSR